MVADPLETVVIVYFTFKCFLVEQHEKDTMYENFDESVRFSPFRRKLIGVTSKALLNTREKMFDRASERRCN